MSRETLEAVVRWQGAAGTDRTDGAGRAAGKRREPDAPDGVGDADRAGAANDRIEITFHGGEPLVPGAKWYRMALPLLRDGLAPHKVRFAIQTNLWLLTDELCELFLEQGVSVGTSLDGPEAINDAQRGKGYFARTMSGIARARAHGLEVGCICTFTAQTAPRANEIFDFFVAEGLDFSVHAALPSLRHPDADRWSLPAEAHGDLLVGLLDRYLAELTRVRISTLDSMCRSVSTGHGGICTFGDCLGNYLAIDPDGAIYPCQRFAGMPQFVLGNVDAAPSADALEASPVWQSFATRERHVAESCGSCPYLTLCRGGCPYNAVVEAGGTLAPTAGDPQCEAYCRTFSAITERAMVEVFARENLEAVVARPDPERGLLRHGRLLSLMTGGSHPREAAGRARRIAAARSVASGSAEDESRLLPR